MNRKEWVKKKLKENDYNTKVVQGKDFYEEFLKETVSEASKESFNRIVRGCKQELIGNVEETETDKDSEDEYEYLGYSQDYLLSILEEATKEKGSSLTIEDVKKLSQKENVPFKAFLYELPDDIDKVLKQIYKVNLFHIENSKHVDKLKKDKSVAEQELKYYKESYGRDEELLNALNQVAKEYKPYNLQFKLPKDRQKERTLVTLASDWHFDEVVHEEQMHGINKYNIEVAKERIDNYFRGVIKNGKELSTDVLYIKLLGDMVSGDLHDLAENNELGSIKSIIELADYIAQHMQNLTKYFSKIRALGLVGNHPRTTKKPQFKNKQKKNYEYLLYEFIKRETRGFCEFEIPESYFKINKVYDINFLSLHGDTIRGGNGLNSIPGNLSRDISLLSGTLGKANLTFDYVDIAHFHSANLTKSFAGAKIIMNGSLIGPNEFSIGALKKGDTPSQTTYMVEEGDERARFIDELKIV